MELFHGPDVAQAQGGPGLSPEGQQAGVSQVFHQRGPAAGAERFVVVNLRHVHAVGVQVPVRGEPRRMRTMVRPDAPKARVWKSSSRGTTWKLR